MRVLAYNMWNGGRGRLAEIRAVIASQRADAVALAEASDSTAVAWLACELGFEWRLGEAPNGLHVAWLSGRPIVRSVNHASSAFAKTLLEVDVDEDGGPVVLFATHLASRHEPMHRPADEVRAILAVLAALGDRPHLLAGDLNALAPGDRVGTPPPGVVPRGEAVPGTPREALPPLQAAGYTDCYRRLHPTEPGYTYTAQSPWLRPDYMFASPALATRLRTCEVVTGEPVTRASDHLPLVAEFA